MMQHDPNFFAAQELRGHEQHLRGQTGRFIGIIRIIRLKSTACADGSPIANKLPRTVNLNSNEHYEYIKISSNGRRLRGSARFGNKHGHGPRARGSPRSGPNETTSIGRHARSNGTQG
jgi:hypothetical protein